jgi:hypothetical protein
VDLTDQIEAGNHTVYVGIIEDGVDDDEARYFDMPVTVVVKEDVVAGRILITLESQMTPFGPGESKELGFRVDNQNNIPLTVLVSLDEPSGWENGAVSVNSFQQAGSTLLVTVDAYSNEKFTVDLTAPTTVKNNDRAELTIIVEPYDEEVPYGVDFKQQTKFEFATSCTEVACLTNELLDPEPSTIGLIGMLVAIVLYATYRRGATRTLAATMPLKELTLPEEVEVGPEMAASELDLPPAVTAGDDDLELLDELSDL